LNFPTQLQQWSAISARRLHTRNNTQCPSHHCPR
jgi:hypothetical protein